jgi:hypothetical protein
MILLDEPDRHFEPKLIEDFIQLVYNHYVKEKGADVQVYLMDKNDSNGKTTIEECERMQVLFKLTYNLRETMKGGVESYIEKLRRYEFENFLYDPVLICSFVINENDFKSYLKVEEKANRGEGGGGDEVSEFQQKLLQCFLALDKFRKNNDSNQIEDLKNNVNSKFTDYFNFLIIENLNNLRGSRNIRTLVKAFFRVSTQPSIQNRMKVGLKTQVRFIFLISF